MHKLAEALTPEMCDQFHTSQNTLSQRFRARINRLKMGKQRFDTHEELPFQILERDLQVQDFFRHVMGFNVFSHFTREALLRYLEDGYQLVSGIGQLEIGYLEFWEVLCYGWPEADNLDAMPTEKQFDKINEELFRLYGLFPAMSEAELQVMMWPEPLDQLEIESLVRQIDTGQFHEMLRMAWMTNAFPVNKLFNGKCFFTSLLSDRVVEELKEHLVQESVERFFQRQTIHSLWHNWNLFPLCAVAELKWLFAQYGISLGMNRERLIGKITPN